MSERWRLIAFKLTQRERKSSGWPTGAGLRRIWSRRWRSSSCTWLGLRMKKTRTSRWLSNSPGPTSGEGNKTLSGSEKCILVVWVFYSAVFYLNIGYTAQCKSLCTPPLSSWFFSGESKMFNFVCLILDLEKIPHIHNLIMKDVKFLPELLIFQNIFTYFTFHRFHRFLDVSSHKVQRSVQGWEFSLLYHWLYSVAINSLNRKTAVLIIRLQEWWSNPVEDMLL